MRIEIIFSSWQRQSMMATWHGDKHSGYDLCCLASFLPVMIVSPSSAWHATWSSSHLRRFLHPSIEEKMAGCCLRVINPSCWCCLESPIRSCSHHWDNSLFDFSTFQAIRLPHTSLFVWRFQPEEASLEAPFSVECMLLWSLLTSPISVSSL